MALKYRKDYVAPHYRLPKTELDFTLHPTRTIVRAKLHFDSVETDKPLVLNGQYMKLKEIAVNGVKLSKKEYELTPETLTIHPDKKKFTLETTVEINPKANTRLMGLYVSNGLFCTQCEPEGFRSITYYPDHSDVLSRFVVTIHADRKKYPVLLANGNRIKDKGDTVVFDDPFDKPCYLFALVAGDLDVMDDTFTTMSGKKVDLHLYSERGKGNRLVHAMESLKKSMAWDEKVFGLEYDLNVFSIVAVSHFNAGAMENKSLNIFNDAALLASPDTATDANYESIEETVAHEYFHNYSGDRVTLRSWFELSLKEGFTVFRQQEFAADMHSRPVKRIDDVNVLRCYQFPEDDGPLAHPVRPDSYHEIDNFYTATIYEKGAEIIRMQQAVVGPKAFAKGCALYFDRYDGQAVTIDDFAQAISDASGKDLTQLKQWYSVAGRPVVTIQTKWEDGVFSVRLKQSHKTCKTPFVIPLHYGLVGSDGRDMKKGTIVLTKKDETVTFKGLQEKPILSVNRMFTSPVDVKIKYTKPERLHLMQYDSDLFNRFEAGYRYASETLIKMIETKAQKPDTTLLKAMGSYFNQKGLDKAFLARALIFPTETELFTQMETVADVAEIKRVRNLMRNAFAHMYQKELLSLYRANQTKGGYRVDTASVAKRALKNVALGYLALTTDADLVMRQYQSADNLTDRMAALVALVHNGLPEAADALADFEKRYTGEDLVMNKWLAVQAQNGAGNPLPRVKELLSHSAFDYKNPNKVRALIGAFSGNLSAFHTPAGYDFFAEQCLIVDKLNPNVAARLLTAFGKCAKLTGKTKAAADKVLCKLAKDKDLSGVSRETVERMI